MQPTTPNVSTAPLALDSFPDGFRALVLGASGGIGQAFVQALQAHPRCAAVLALHRRSEGEPERLLARSPAAASTNGSPGFRVA